VQCRNNSKREENLNDSAEDNGENAVDTDYNSNNYNELEYTPPVKEPASFLLTRVPKKLQ